EQRDEVAVVQQILQLVLDVTVIHVDGHCADLERREHRHEVLVPVVEIHADVLAGLDAAIGEKVRETIRLAVELRVREAPGPADQRLAVGHGVGDQLEKVGDVQLHRLFLFLAQGFSAPTIHIEKNCEPPPYAWPSAILAPSTWCSPAEPRTCIAASAKRSMPDAPIGLDDSTPPDGLIGRSPSNAVTPSSDIFQPSFSSAKPRFS